MNKNQSRREAFVRRARDILVRVGGYLRSLFVPMNQPKYEDSPEYQKELEYFRNFEAIESKEGEDKVDYSPVVDYAKENLARCEQTDKTLDEKADSIIQYLGGGTAVVAIGAFLSIKPEDSRACIIGFAAILSLLPSFWCVLKAVGYAVASRTPQPVATIQGIDFAVNCAHAYKRKEIIEVNIWMLLNPICHAYHQRNKFKAMRVKKAHTYYMWALALFILPLIAIAVGLLHYHFVGDAVPPAVQGKG